MKKILLLMAVLAMSASFFSCSDDDKSKLIGTWRYTHPTEGWYDQFTFRSDMTGTYRFVDSDGFAESDSFTFSDTGKMVTIIWGAGGQMTLTYEIDGKDLLLNFGGGLSLIYTKI